MASAIAPAGLAVLLAMVAAGCPARHAANRPGREDAPPPREPAVAPAISDTDQAASRAARSLGPAGASVTVYEMSDFQCPFCRRHALVTLPELEREYINTGRIRYVFVNYPITEIHPNAVPAAEIGLCSARQSRFWEVHHLLFERQDAWAPLADPEAALLGIADSAGVDRAALLACLAEPGVRQAVEFEARGSARTGANATPSFYIEGGLLIGAQPIDVWRPILDSILQLRMKSGK